MYRGLGLGLRLGLWLGLGLGLVDVLVWCRFLYNPRSNVRHVIVVHLTRHITLKVDPGGIFLVPKL